MKSGLLWFDANADKNLMDVIDAAAKRYREKFGVNPDICYVNTTQLKEFATAHRDALPHTLNLAVLPKNTIIRNHVWLGISNPMPRDPKERLRAMFVKPQKDIEARLCWIGGFDVSEFASMQDYRDAIALAHRIVSGAEGVSLLRNGI